MATTTTVTNSDLMDAPNKKGVYWSIAALVVTILIAAMIFTSPRNNATSNADEGNNMSNTNSGYMNTN